MIFIKMQGCAPFNNSSNLLTKGRQGVHLVLKLVFTFKNPERKSVWDFLFPAVGFYAILNIIQQKEQEEIPMAWKNKVKITVLKKTWQEDLAEEYLANPTVGPCSIFQGKLPDHAGREVLLRSLERHQPLRLRCPSGRLGHARLDPRREGDDHLLQ